MAYVTGKELDEFIAVAEKEGIKYKNRKDAEQSANRLMQFAELTLKIYREEKARKDKLIKNPDGYLFDGEGRSCSLCHRCVIGNMWYDKWGMKCIDCHEAFKKRIIPGYVFKDRDYEKHILLSTIAWKFDIPTQTLKKLVREGKIKARTIKGNGEQIVLRRDNPNLSDILVNEKAELEIRRQKKSN